MIDSNKVAVDKHGGFVEDENGLAPLHLAARFGLASEATRLLEAGASPSAKAKNGKTALHFGASLPRRLRVCVSLWPCLYLCVSLSPCL